MARIVSPQRLMPLAVLCANDIKFPQRLMPRAVLGAKDDKLRKMLPSIFLRLSHRYRLHNERKTGLQ